MLSGLDPIMGTACKAVAISQSDTPETIAEQGKLMESYGADVVLVTDSAGALMPDTVKQRVAALKIGVGFHGHNNLSLAVSNSVAAIEEGARWIDACTCGLGAGSGNTPTEVLAAVLDKMGYETGINLWKIMDVAENIVRPIMPKPVRIGNVSLTMGYAGVYSSFLLYADKAAEQFGVDAPRHFSGAGQTQGRRRTRGYDRRSSDDAR
jgi:4-hydroxy-2-oxovalerate aldolase